jgi:hypothetical protein
MSQVRVLPAEPFFKTVGIMHSGRFCLRRDGGRFRQQIKGLFEICG